jgi:predicted permease
MSSFFRKLKWLTKHSRKEAEIKEELEFYLEEETRELEECGVAKDEARWAARRGLGNFSLVQEDTRAAWTWIWWEQLGQDLRYAVHTMLADKTFTALSVLSLALGIGANTAIFSFMDSILLRALPVADPHSLAILSWHTPDRTLHGTDRHDDSFNDPNGGFTGGFFSYTAFEVFTKDNTVFSSVFGYQGAGKLNLTFHGQAELADTEYVSGDYFSGLGVPATAGRLIVPDDDRGGAADVAVISFALSQRRFGGPENALSQSVLINNSHFTVIGVTPPEFFGADPDVAPDVYVPLHANLILEADNPYVSPAKFYLNPAFDWIVPMARLKPGVTIAEAQAALAGPFFEWGRVTKPSLKVQDVPRLVIREGASGLDSLRRRYSKPLYILLTLVGLILAIACANIANLLLARAAVRKREIAVRLSIGAGRLRVIRQLLTESVLLAAVGGVLGVGVALWGIRFLTWLLSNGLQDFSLHSDLNWHVLGIVAGLSLMTGVLFGLAPALQATKVDLVPALKQSRGGDGFVHGFHSLRLSPILIVLQISITLLILVAAGLFVRTLSNLASIELGFNRENLLTFALNARQAGHKDPEIVTFYNDLQKRFSDIPGVRAVSLSNQTLLGTGAGMTNVGLASGALQDSNILAIGSGFFKTMQIPVLLGREIEDRDKLGSPMVAVVNQEFAKLSFGDRNPLGERLTLPGVCLNCTIEVVGVCTNSLYGSLKGKMPPIVYLPFAQGAWGPARLMYYEVRTVGNPLGYVNTVRDLVRQADDRLPVSEVKTQGARIEQMINQEITFARLCNAFALLALVIACVGLYGTMSYNVARRTSEIGIRMALGAQGGSVVWMVLREVCLLAAVGLAISVPIALATSKVVESFLFEMKPNDPLTLTGAATTLSIAMILSGYLPARRASRIDPMAALRNE